LSTKLIDRFGRFSHQIAHFERFRDCGPVCFQVNRRCGTYSGALRLVQEEIMKTISLLAAFAVALFSGFMTIEGGFLGAPQVMADSCTGNCK
jgi:hypothetical protein